LMAGECWGLGVIDHHASSRRVFGRVRRECLNLSVVEAGGDEQRGKIR
jgi:hypothetical protein